jgi:alpha-galactosidase
VPGDPPTENLVVIDAGDAGLVLAVGDDGLLHQIAFGPGAAQRRPDLPVGLYPLAYPTFGEEPLREAALRITHGDGATSTRLRFVSARREPADDGTGEEHRIEMRDRVAPVSVVMAFRTWPAYGIVEQWVEVANSGDGPCTLHRAAAGAPVLAGIAPHLTHFGGGWGREWTETTEALTSGTKTVASTGGVRSSLTLGPLVLVAPDGPATETTGAVVAATVLWGGDVRVDAELFHEGQVRLHLGHQPRGAERVLDPGERFGSPHVAWAWSDAGKGPTSRALHRFAREQLIRDGTRTRATVANTWEAVGFGLDPDGLGVQVDRAADLGAELFLLDDGWFGSSRPRDDDTTALGDWAVDRRKFPDGLQPLIDHTVARGLRFGLWVEPEMVNPQSDLYDAHPEWVIAQPGRERREHRQQLVLDLCRPEVRAFAIDVIDRILTEHRGIGYLKWDANRDLSEPGSAALAPGRQSHLALDRVSGTWDVMAEVARRHPDVELMLCASGGGRADLGTLRFFHELWTSDNTDPVDRVAIQWGASHLLPASVLGAHVTRWGNRPVAFGCAVAMSARFGFDLDLRALNDHEWVVCRDAVVAYHRIRELVQGGNLNRLVSPVGSTRAALGYLSNDGARSVVFAYRLPGDPVPEHPITVPWTDSGGPWRVRDLTPGRTGAERVVHLDGGTVPWPIEPGPSASVLEITTR